MSWRVVVCERDHLSQAPEPWRPSRCWCGGSLGEPFEVVRAPTLDGPGQARRDDPGTSKKAANVNIVKRGTQRWAILVAIADAGVGGRTSHELEERTDIRYASLTPRIGELKRGGFIVGSGEERRGRYGVDQEVVVATNRGLSMLGRDRSPSMYDPSEDG